MYEKLGQIDDKYIEEADASNIKKKNGRKKTALRVILIAAVIVLAGAMVFIPVVSLLHGDSDVVTTTEQRDSDDPITDDILKYADSDYYEIIKKLNDYKQSYQVNDGDDDVQFADEYDPGEDGYDQDQQKYVEVTDNQAQGVIEGDLIKRSDKYIYYLRYSERSVLEVYPADIELDIKAGESTTIDPIGSYNVDNGAIMNAEIFLSEDCGTITVIYTVYISSKERNTFVLSLDVTDPGNIKEISRLTLSGAFFSSRMINGKFYVFTRYDVQNYYYNNNEFTFSFDDPDDFIPYINKGAGRELFSADQIICPDDVNYNGYTCVYMLDGKTAELEDEIALLSYGSTVYVSSSNIYVARNAVTAIDKSLEYQTVSNKCDITRISYDGTALKYCGTVTVSGTASDRFNFDEYNGILRVVTSVSESVIKRDFWTYNENGTEKERYYFYSGSGITSASLYCVDIEEMRTVASVEKFAPNWESVRSVRFDGDHGYVCTSVEVTDPVFFFDLSDINNITYTDTGTISGFSSSLIDFKDGYLLGIGKGEDLNTKVEIYRKEGDRVISVSKFEYKGGYNTTASEYKAFFIDRERGLVGLPCYEYISVWDEHIYYSLLEFDGNEITEAYTVDISVNYSYLNKVRGVLVGEYFYIFSDTGICNVIRIDIE